MRTELHAFHLFVTLRTFHLTRQADLCPSCAFSLVISYRDINTGPSIAAAQNLRQCMLHTASKIQLGQTRKLLNLDSTYNDLEVAWEGNATTDEPKDDKAS